MAQRIGRRTRVKADAVADYRNWHAKIWRALLELNAAAGIRNYTIFIEGADLFSYFEVDDLDATMAVLKSSDAATKWQEIMAPLMEDSHASNPWIGLEEVFHQD